MTTTIDLEQQVVELVTHTAQLTRWASALADDDTPRAIARALSLLAEHGELRVSDFARLDRCSQPTATALVGKLTALGLATRHRDPDDSRAVVVGLSDAGRAQLARTRAAIGTAVTPHLTCVEPQLIERIVHDLATLQAAVKQSANQEIAPS